MLMISDKKEDYLVLAPEVLDTFLQTLLSWYREEARHEEEMPNLYAVLGDEHIYSNSFYELFAESVCWSRYRLGVGEAPNEEGYFSGHTYDSAMEEIGDCIDDYYPKFFRDTERVLNELNLSFRHYNYYAETPERHWNTSLQKVW